MWVRTYIAQLSAAQAELYRTEYAVSWSLWQQQRTEKRRVLSTFLKVVVNAGREVISVSPQPPGSQHVCSCVIKKKKKRLCNDNSPLLYRSGCSPERRTRLQLRLWPAVWFLINDLLCPCMECFLQEDWDMWLNQYHFFFLFLGISPILMNIRYHVLKIRLHYQAIYGNRVYIFSMKMLYLV